MTRHLPPCPESPNCVSSEHHREDRRIEPLPFAGGAEAAMDHLEALIAEQSGAQIENRQPLSLHATFRSKILRFVDDLHAVADPETSVIHWRSASRTGYWDFGANQRRIESLREGFTRTG